MALQGGTGPVSVIDGRKVVAAGGTAEALTSTKTRVHSVDITAEADNTGVIVVGGSTVVAALATRRGTPLNAGDTKTYLDVDLSQIYIDATVNGDGVTFDYVGR